MPFDASYPPDEGPFPPRAAPPRRDRQPPLTLGVFHYGGAWKLYGEFERAAAYPNRALALSAAETRALEAARCGRRVELFIQDENGELRQAAVEPH
jgi:hypothetical protein